MSDEIKKPGTKNDEIDLFDLFSRLGRSITGLLNGLGHAFLHILFFMVRKWLWLGLSVIIGIGASFVIKSTTERLYSSDIILRSNAIPNTDMISYINKLHTFCREGNYGELAAALSVDESKVKGISDIQAFWVIDRGSDKIPDYVDFKSRHDVLDTVNVRMQDRFVIRVRTFTPQDLISIREGILSFVEKNTFFQQQNELRIKQNVILMDRFDYEIDQLDSLQKVKYFEEARRLMPKEGGQMVFLQENTTQLLHNDIYALFQMRQDIERQLTIYSDLITMLSDFTPPARPENGALFYGKVVIPLIFGVTLLLLILVDNRKRLVNIYKKY